MCIRTKIKELEVKEHGLARKRWIRYMAWKGAIQSLATMGKARLVIRERCLLAAFQSICANLSISRGCSYVEA
jgi:hypothetical protein